MSGVRPKIHKVQRVRCACAVSEAVRIFTACPTAEELFTKFADATREHFLAADDLSMLTGQHDAFAEALNVVNEKRLKSHAARRALEQHWEEHGCRYRDLELQEDGEKMKPANRL
jgi:hypothetical protein